MPIKVVLVDDSRLVRERVADALRDFAHVNVAAEYEAANEAIDGVSEHSPDLVVLDIELKQSNGMQVLQHVVKNHPMARVFIFSNYSDAQQRSRFLSAGAHGFYSKTNEFDQMLDAIDTLI